VDALGAQAAVVTRSVTDLALDDAALDALLAEGWSGIALATNLAPISADREVVRRSAELLLAVVRAAARRGEGASPLSVTLLARGLADLDGAALVPLRALARGVAQVAGQELRDVRVRVVDPGTRPSMTTLLGELAAGRDEPAFSALAGGHRWLPVPGPVPDSPAASALVDGGVYLITGGLGEVGLRLAEHLARTRRAKLVLTSRVGLLARGEWSGWLASHVPTDPVSRRIRRLQALEQSGAEVLTAAADVADETRMAELVTEVVGRWGRLDGAIHAAGLAGSAAFRAAADTTAGHLGEHLRAKVEGTRVLAKVLPASTRFALLMSSISTVLGGVGLLAYAAASHFLDAFALGREGQPGPRFISVAWDAWRPEGVKAEALDAMGLSSEEAVTAMERILALPGVPAAVVSTLPLEARIADVAAAGRALLERAGAGGRAPGTIHPRPELDTPFVAPRDDLEEAIAAIWRELFSLDRVGVQDSFFALGGDSLLAIQLGTRLRERLEVDLPINELFEQPTVESVAKRVRAAQESAQAQLRSTLEMVEGLSDAEVRAMLVKLERGEKAPGPAPDARLVPERYHFEPGGPVDRGEVRRFYDSVSQQLDGSPYRDHALFLNYGYVSNDAPSFAAVALPPQLPSRNSIRLVVELVGRHLLRPSDRVLDVGCGRGGTVHVLRRFFTVGDVVGLDLSPVAVAFCRRRHGDARTSFVEGDAHHLPFPDQSFDVITNVESSHAYGEVDPFLVEVARVLRPGGVFLYTDVVAADALGPRESRFATLGLCASHRRDITPNVLLSCDETARMNARAFAGGNDAGMLERFLAVPESDLYREMKAGRQRYMLYHLQRSP
jgi:SAM-dependent methyltransferase/NAD(P)-dependent dehydrogenase (short-subunit alcohol dehydrogenase family)/acyl carrier protein